MENDDKTNILIVDDLQDKLMVLETVLEELGQNIITARSGREALRRILEKEFAVILLDVNMPDMDGFETAALIRKRKQSALTPIIFITAFTDEVHTAQGYSMGAVDYIYSPVVPEILRAKVSVFVELFRKTEQIRRQAEERVALAREQAARVAAEEATRRSSFLAEASTVLASSLEPEATVGGLLRLAVPNLCDLAGVTLVEEHGPPRRSDLAWVQPPDPTVHMLSLTCHDEPENELRTARGRVLALGKAEVLEGLDLAYPPGERERISTALIHAAVLFPLVARGRTLGALTLAWTGPNQRFAPHDLALAEDLAGRAAIALDNAQLYCNIQEADRRKNEFLAMLAHELRNPLAPIRSAVHVMRLRGSQEPEVVWARDMIDRQVQHLVRLVDDLLDVSRITRGKITLQVEPVDIATVVAHAVETSRPLIDSRKHELIVSLPESPLRLEGDPTRLAQVLANLLNNAAKYTEEGGRIWLTAAREGEEAILRVRDSGVGILPDMLAKVFDLFTQVDRTLDRAQGGMGIGLTLVRRLVELHGGSVQALSGGPGKGTEFVVRLPAFPESRSCREGPNGQKKSAGNHAARRVLVVDDNPDAAESLGTLLRLGGHDVRTAPDGPAALKMVESFPPEVVLLDIGLPGMDGYEVARILREEKGLGDAVLIAMTGYGREEDQRRSREAGFDHHLVKPVDLGVLQGVLAARPPTPASQS